MECSFEYADEPSATVPNPSSDTMPAIIRNDPMTSTLAAPRYWPTWVGVGVMWLVAQLPLRAQFALGHAIGAIGYRFARARRHIATVNIELCFPELDEVGARCAGATHLRIHRYRRRRNGDRLVRRHLAIARPSDFRRARRADDRTTARPRRGVDRRAFFDTRPRGRAAVAGGRPRRDLPLQQESGDRVGDAARARTAFQGTSSNAAIRVQCSHN